MINQSSQHTCSTRFQHYDQLKTSVNTHNMQWLELSVNDQLKNSLNKQIEYSISRLRQQSEVVWLVPVKERKVKKEIHTYTVVVATILQQLNFSLCRCYSNTYQEHRFNTISSKYLFFLFPFVSSRVYISSLALYMVRMSDK